MLRTTTLSVILLTALTVWAQPSGSQPYQPSVPAGSSYSAYGGYYDTGGGTVEGSMMQGMASVISAAGDYNLSSSAAAVNLTQAQKQDIENRVAATHAYFDIRDINRAAAAARRKQVPSHEQLVRVAAQAAAKPLTPSELDPVSGRIVWPEVLRDEMFADDRAVIEKLIGKLAQYGQLGISDLDIADQSVDKLNEKLQGVIRKVSSQKYLQSKNFLKSLMRTLNQPRVS